LPVLTAGLAGDRTSVQSEKEHDVIMAATGELIRLMNYADDIVTTVRRISASVPAMEPEERKKLADYLGSSSNGLAELVAKLRQEAA